MIGWYARPSPRLVRQVVADVCVVCWTVGWAFAGALVSRFVLAIAGLGAATGEAARQTGDDFAAAARAAEQIPGVGRELRQSFEDTVQRLDGIAVSLDHQVLLVERIAALGGWLTFLLPVGLLVAIWLPVRLRFLRQTRAIRRMLDARVDLDLFALRAMATQPMDVLAAVSDDPVGAWRSGDLQVITALADLELRSAGVELPAGLATGD